MSSFCLVSNKQVVGSPQSYKFHHFRPKDLGIYDYRSFSVMPQYSFTSLCSQRSHLYSSFRGDEVYCSKNEGVKVDGVDGKRRFSLRIRPRLRLLTTRLKRVQIRSTLNDFGVFLRKHLKKVTIATSISLALGVCYLFVKIMSIPFPKSVPYSDLLVNLQSGSVSKVLFEEGSRRIYFNTKVESLESSGKEAESLPLDDTVEGLESSGKEVESLPLDETVGSLESSRKEVESLPLDETVESLESSGKEVESLPLDGGVVAAKTNVISRSMGRKKASLPEWQFATRKVDNDESFLLSLMRENAVAYSSAPQSVMMSVRTVLLTILTLWIPLTPLMWILYRQLNSANSPAKKRKPSNQTVSFDDVEGVDSAKVELLEVYVFTLSLNLIHNDFHVKFMCKSRS